jgi:hypothetical protein
MVLILMMMMMMMAVIQQRQQISQRRPNPQPCDQETLKADTQNAASTRMT